MSVKMQPVSIIEIDMGLEPYGEVHNYFASRCKARMQKYTPNSTGDAGKDSNLNTPIIDRQCNILYEEEYASYQYYGQRRDGSRKIQNWTTPGTGPYWDELMISAEGKELVQEMTDYVNERGIK